MGAGAAYLPLPAGRTAAAGSCGEAGSKGIASKASGGGKSGLHDDTVAANGRRGRPQGKCHRKQTARQARFRAENPSGKGETVGQEPTARPATEAARQTPPGARPNRGGMPGNRQRRFRVAARVGRTRRSATGVPEEWPSIALTGEDRTRLTGRLTRLDSALRVAFTTPCVSDRSAHNRCSV